MFSVVQNRALANGKSFEIANTTVFFNDAASLLNLRTEVAHVDVSRLGKMFNTTLFPLSDSNESVDRSVFVSSKFGALLPTSGNLPLVSTGVPFNFILDIVFLFCLFI